MQPLILFSLPRSGSTLAQKILGAHEEIRTVAEPWLLLPLLYARRRRGVYAEYNHGSMVAAIDDFVARMPGGAEDYREELRTLVMRLYERASGGPATYFLDKTPRYHLIADEIHELFPHGRFLYLWRNPLAVVASMIDTFCGGKWRMSPYRVDLYAGLASLVESQRRHAERATVLRYEDFVSHPEREWTRVFEDLELPFRPELLDNFASVQLGGRMGDPKIRNQPKINPRGLERWRQTLSNPVRKAWCRRYLHWIGAERLKAMGYPLEDLLASIDRTPTTMRGTGADLLRVPYSMLYATLELDQVRARFRALRDRPAIHPHL